jgi:DHA1 family bicyclomycin/chloramphenicol resistance-like MFS transporter
LLSNTFSLMLVGRFLQGVGVAGPRTITLALVRDRFEGREMARVMSLITVVFILCPIVAPAIGQVILGVYGWRTIFGVYLTMGLVATIWFGLRQEETLPSHRRLPFSIGRMAAAVREVVTHRRSIGYTVASGYVFGAFLGYLTSAQQILQQQYALGSQFPLYFAMLAIAIGGASFVNASLVMRYGMRLLSTWSLRGICVVSIIFGLFASASAGHPPLWTLMTYLLASFFGIGLLFGNLNALAMQPLGHIAGTGAAVVGATSMLISLAFGTWIGQSYNGTVMPLVIGFAVLSACSIVTAWWAESGRSKEQDIRDPVAGAATTTEPVA